MTPRQLQKLIDELWERHATPDHHGYKDLMREGAFAAAIKEALEEVDAA